MSLISLGILFIPLFVDTVVDTVVDERVVDIVGYTVYTVVDTIAAVCRRWYCKTNGISFVSNCFCSDVLVN